MQVAYIKRQSVIILESPFLHSDFGGSSRYIVKNDKLLNKEDKNEKKEIEYESNAIKEREQNIAAFLDATDNNLFSCTNPVINAVPSALVKKSTTQHKKRGLEHLNKSRIKSKILSFSRLKQSMQQMYFVTISFPLLLPDDICYKVFNIWLTKLRQHKFLHSYIWVAERQENTTIHFHMLVNNTFPVFKANILMRNTLLFYHKAKKFNYDYAKLLSYNGVDLDKDRKTKIVINFALLKNAKILSQYLTKYVSKNQLAWIHKCNHCSNDISALFISANTDLSDEFLYNELIKLKHDYCTKYDFCHVFAFKLPLPNFFFTKMEAWNELIYNTICK